MPTSRPCVLKVTDSNSTIDIYIIAGPTASGKTGRAIELAQEKDGVIINADSMQIYDALPTLTAQPSTQEKASAPHELFAVMHPSEICSAQMWRELALRQIYETGDQGKTPIIAGGTGFYLKALMEGFSPIPDIAPEVREQGTILQQELGNPGFHEELAKHDPVMAQRLNPNDTQRLIRAWEVLEGTGKSLSYWQEQPPTGAPEGLKFHIEIIMPERDILYGRCNRRFDQMIKNGALEEVKALDEAIQNKDVSPDASITHALGFIPLRDYIHGKLPLEGAVDRSKQETRNYAKRQITWLRNQLSPSTKKH